MKIILATGVAIAALCAGSAAMANVPVSDKPILTQRSEDSAAKVQIKTIQEDTKSANQGVNCAVTTPRKADKVKSPTQTVDPKAGKAALEKANPDITGSSAFASTGGPSGSTGGNAGERSLLDGTGQVLGGMNGSMATVAPNKQVFESMGQDIGTDKTINEAMDRNSAIRLQGGLTFNEVVQATGFFAQAFNMGNIATSTMTSRGSAGLVVPAPPPPPAKPGNGSSTCPAGTAETTPGQVPGCVTSRTTDTVENVSPMLSRMQTEQQNAPVSMTTDELLSAVQQYQGQ